MLSHHLRGRPITADLDLGTFAQKIDGMEYSASDIKVLADEAAKIAMRSEEDISAAHLLQAANERVPTSISSVNEEVYLSFGKLVSV